MNPSNLSFTATRTGIMPFLSVLNCAIGTMILVLVAGGLKAVVEDAELSRLLAAAKARRTALQVKLDRQTALLDRLHDENERTDAEVQTLQRLAADALQQARTKQARLRERRTANEAARLEVRQRRNAIQRRLREAAELRALPQTLDLLGQVRGVRTVRDRVGKALRVAEAERKRLEDEIELFRRRYHLLRAKRRAPLSPAELLEDWDPLKAIEKPSDPDASAGRETVPLPLQVRFRPHSGGRRQARPAYLELTPARLVVHSAGLSVRAGSRIPWTDRRRLRKTLARLAKDLRRGRERFAVLFVRPSAGVFYFETVRALLRRRVPFVYQPVEPYRQLRFVQWRHREE